MKIQVKFDLLRPDGSFVTTLRASDKAFNYKLNDIGTASCVINTTKYDPKIIEEIDTNYALQVRLEGVGDNNQNINKVVWLGRITSPDKSYDSSKGVEVKIEAQEYLGLLQLELNTGTYNNIIESELVWQLINNAQTDTTLGGRITAGELTTQDIDLGFIKGFLDPNTVTRDLVASDDDLVKIFKTFTNSGGGDIEITPCFTKNTTKEVSWYAKRGSYRPDLLYELQLQKVDQLYEAEVYNLVIGYGKDKISAFALDIDSIKKNGKRTTVINLPEIVLQSELQARVNAELERLKQPRLAYKFDVIDTGNFGKFDVGDEIRFRFVANGLALDNTFRVLELGVKAGDSDEIGLSMTVSNSLLPVGFSGSFVKKYKETNRKIYQNLIDINKI